MTCCRNTHLAEQYTLTLHFNILSTSMSLSLFSIGYFLVMEHKTGCRGLLGATFSSWVHCGVQRTLKTLPFGRYWSRHERRNARNVQTMYSGKYSISGTAQRGNELPFAKFLSPLIVQFQWVESEIRAAFTFHSELLKEYCKLKRTLVSKISYVGVIKMHREYILTHNTIIYILCLWSERKKWQLE